MSFSLYSFENIKNLINIILLLLECSLHLVKFVINFVFQLIKSFMNSINLFVRRISLFFNLLWLFVDLFYQDQISLLEQGLVVSSKLAALRIFQNQVKLFLLCSFFSNFLRCIVSRSHETNHNVQKHEVQDKYTDEVYCVTCNLIVGGWKVISNISDSQLPTVEESIETCLSKLIVCVKVIAWVFYSWLLQNVHSVCCSNDEQEENEDKDSNRVNNLRNRSDHTREFRINSQKDENSDITEIDVEAWQKINEVLHVRNMIIVEPTCQVEHNQVQAHQLIADWDISMAISKVVPSKLV